MIQLGSRVRDVYTGFEGTAIARTEWLYGCARVSVEPTELKDGKVQDTVTFDEQRLEVLTDAAPIVSPASSATTGGPHPDPVRGR
jgi:hypothetical protein